MPENGAPKPAAKAGKFATRKIGPLPVWAWGLTAIAFIGLVWYLRKTQGDEVTVTSTDSDYGQEPIGGAPALVGGDGNGGFSGGGGYVDIPFPEQFPVTSVAPDWPYSPQPPQPIYEEPTSPVQTQPTTEQAQPEPTTKTAPAPTKQTVFTWSGKTFRKGDLAAFRKLLKSLPKSSIYSGPNGYATWATNHPKVVADFGWPKK